MPNLKNKSSRLFGRKRLLLSPQHTQRVCTFIVSPFGVVVKSNIERRIFIMQKNRNTTLAFDVLKEEQKRTALWKAAFMVVLVVFMVSRITRKSGTV